MTTKDAHDEDAAVAARFEAGQVSSFAELVAELALSYADERTPEPRATLVEQIVTGATGILPGVVAAAVETLDAAGRLTAPVLVGDDVARRLMNAQNAAGEGPCLDALHDHKQVAVLDLSADDRWPTFAAEARAAGVMAVICTPMEVNGRGVGVLTLLSNAVDFGDEHEDVESLARVFAAHAGLALTGARQLRDMNTAMSSRDIIGQAKGILMERFRVTPDVAFTVLVRASSVTNTKLRAVCEQLCETGTLPAGALDRRAPR
jgi:AmiR/NasT family two-component response regulator